LYSKRAPSLFGMEWMVNNEIELEMVAVELIKELGERKILLLYGDLGAGKTTFVRYIIRQFNSTDECSSPTFSLINHYESPDGPIYHMDMYRLKDLSEAVDIGVEEYLDSGSFCIIEWPELLEPILPQDSLRVRIEVLPGHKRKIIV